MLCQRRRRWRNIKQALGGCLVLAGGACILGRFVSFIWPPLLHCDIVKVVCVRGDTAQGQRDGHCPVLEW